MKAQEKDNGRTEDKRKITKIMANKLTARTRGEKRENVEIGE